MYKVEADAFTSAAGNNVWSIKREQMGSTGVREHGEHEIVSHSVPGRPCVSSKEYPPHKEHFIQGGRNGMQGVGFAHSANEAGNDGGGKGRTYKPF